jgi:O-antigen/teichoic acid export membrane protein
LSVSMLGNPLASVAAGTATGAAVAGLSSLVLTRLYEPAHFGVLAVAMAATSLALAAAAGKFDAAVPLERDDAWAAQTAYAAATCSVAASLATACLLLALSPWFARLDHIGVVTLALLPPIVALAGLAQTGFGLALRSESYRQVGIGRAVGPSAAAIIQILLGSFWPSGEALVIGQVAGLLCVSTLLWMHARTRLSWPGWQGLRAAVQRHWRMPAFMASSNLLTMAGLHAPLVLLGSGFSLATAGIYAVTYRVLTAPALLLGQSIGQVFYARVAREEAADKRRAIVEQTSGTLFDISAIVFSWLVVCAPGLFRFAFGERWEASGEYARLLAPWLAASFVASPISQYAVVCGRQSAVLKIALVETAARALSLGIGLAADSARVLVGSFAAAGAVISSIYVVWILALADVRWRTWLGQRAASAATGMVVLGLLALEDTPGLMVARIVLTAAAALASAWIIAQRLGYPCGRSVTSGSQRSLSG